ncbi:MAG: hypothetical protein KGK30_04660, partial [Elusimicrobia bacterium]|nr:hypothetical protein [Elusimicrobiota bacterium]
MRRPASPPWVYRRLLRAFGRRGWWPVSGASSAPAYRPGVWGKLSERQRAEICVGAILTQNTAWGNVLRALENLRAADARDFKALLALPPRRLETLIRPSGYFRQKARKLRIFAERARERGRLSRWLSRPLPELREELLGLWGVGPETADSILLYAGGRPAFVVDAYTLRLGRRLGWFAPRSGYAEAQDFFTRALAR